MRAVIVVVDGVLRDEFDAFRSVFGRMVGVDVVTVAARLGRFAGPGGSVTATATFDDIWSSDILAVPGSLGCRRAADDPDVRNALHRIAAVSRLVVASSTGSILLAAAGVLRDESVATHWLAADLIGRYGCTRATERLVTTGKTITCSGVLTALDAALLVADRIEGDGAAARIRGELLAAGAHHVRSGTRWRRLVSSTRAAVATRSTAPSVPAVASPTPLSVMIELVDDPKAVDRLRRNAARRPGRRG